MRGRKKMRWKRIEQKVEEKERDQGDSTVSKWEEETEWGGKGLNRKWKKERPRSLYRK